ncbi:MAG: arylesterase [Candidatus Kaiserbacteria bacterium]|nr:arylesterase [Candidatus Kaiserbacteria bacterium]MCB9816900.1 arylesterase [Candidatus Nomurabacteria bacterium]
MSRKIVILAIFSIILLSWFFWPKADPLYPTTGSTVVVFGDSLAAGIGAGSGSDIASLLSQSLPQEVINLGVPGDTTADGLARIDEVLEVDPRVVIVLLGGNDALQQVPVEKTFANLALIVESIQASGAAVVLVGEPGGLYGNRYEKEYERIVEEYRTFYVSNILSGLIGRSEYMSDYIHPNSTGYARATERILPVVEKALEGE